MQAGRKQVKLCPVRRAQAGLLSPGAFACARARPGVRWRDKRMAESQQERGREGEIIKIVFMCMHVAHDFVLELGECMALCGAAPRLKTCFIPFRFVFVFVRRSHR